MATKFQSTGGHYIRNFMASENDKAKTYGIWIDMELFDEANPVLSEQLRFKMVMF